MDLSRFANFRIFRPTLAWIRCSKKLFKIFKICERCEIRLRSLVKINIKKAGRNRQFSRRDIEKLQRIVDLINKDGHTIEGTKDQLRQKASTDKDREEVIDRLLEIRKSLVFLRNGIESHN